VELSANRRNDSSFVPTIRVLSGQPFQVKLLSQTRGVTSEQILAVQAPTTQTAPSTMRGDCNDCYMATNTDKLQVLIQNDATGASNNGWVAISDTTPKAIGTYTWVISNKLTVYYPLKTTAFHSPNGFGSAQITYIPLRWPEFWCDRSVDSNGGYPTKHYSSNTEPCPNSLQKHRWYGIPDLINCSGNGLAQAVVGCQYGMSWTVIPQF